MNAAWSCIEQTAGGIAVIDVTGVATYTLSVANDSPDQARMAMLQFTGSNPAACTVTIPSVARMGWVSNNSTNTIILTTASSPTVLSVAAGATFLYTCDGQAVRSVTIGGVGVLNAAAGVLVNNTKAYAAQDSTNAARNLLSIDAANNTNLTMGGGTSWRVLNQAGTTALLTILPTGAATFAQGLTVTGPINASGTLNVVGAVTMTSLTVTGTTTFATTQSSPAGVISAGYDAGGFNFRMTNGNYGSGWRNDGVASYLLLTPSGSALGLFNTLRPITVNNTTGAVTLDGTGVGTLFGGRVTAHDAVFSTGSLHLPNNQSIFIKDSVGNDRRILTIGSDNFTNIYNGGGVGWRVINQAGTASLLTISDVGAAVFAGGVAATSLAATGNIFGNALGATTTIIGATLSATGNVSGAGGIFTNMAVSGNIAGGTASWTGATTMTGVLTANGATNVAGTGGIVDGSGSHGATSFSGIAMSVVAANGVTGVGFYATSDARMKTDIEDILPETAYTWIKAGRPRTYMMNGRHSAGFVAQEDIQRGRAAAVTALADDRAEFAVSDGIARAGHRLVRRYEHDIAYVTAALQGALARIEALEAKLAAG